MFSFELRKKSFREREQQCSIEILKGRHPAESGLLWLNMPPSASMDADVLKGWMPTCWKGGERRSKRVVCKCHERIFLMPWGDTAHGMSNASSWHEETTISEHRQPGFPNVVNQVFRTTSTRFSEQRQPPFWYGSNKRLKKQLLVSAKNYI